jgi:hypothetical protein
MSCSSLSTEHGPAIIVKPEPPTSTPSTFTTESAGCDSRLTMRVALLHAQARFSTGWEKAQRLQRVVRLLSRRFAATTVWWSPKWAADQ